MSTLIITGALGVLIIVLAIILLTGRGSNLVAGFNTMPKDEKTKYDAKALSKFIGKILLPIGILIPLSGKESIAGWYAWVFVAVTLGLCVFAVIYANTGNRFKK